MDRQRVAARLVGLAKALLADEEESRTAESTAYQKYFQKKLKETGKSSPSEMSDAEKKKFFEDIDKGYESEREKGEKDD